MKVSIILPTFNEAGNIIPLCKEIIKNISPGWKYEIIIVDDNSPDHTFELAQQAFKDNHNIKSILRTRDRGLARSIRMGIEYAVGEKVLIMDTDFSHDPKEIPNHLYICRLYDLVSGSRFSPGGNMESRRHYYASYIFNLLIRFVLSTHVQDNLAGYFIIDKVKLDKLPLDSIFYGYGEYYFRLLYYAQQQRLSMIEIPVYYRSRVSGSSKSNFLKLIWVYTRELVNLKIKVLLHKPADGA